jgi:hypothetical protein
MVLNTLDGYYIYIYTGTHNDRHIAHVVYKLKNISPSSRNGSRSADRMILSRQCKTWAFLQCARLHPPSSSFLIYIVTLNDIENLLGDGMDMEIVGAIGVWYQSPAKELRRENLR